MTKDEIIAKEAELIVHTYRRPDFVLERGSGCHLYDTEGNRYLDLVAGIAVNNLGYGDPEVLEAIATQAERLIHVSNLYHMQPHIELAEQLVEASFADKVFFCNSGTEAVEAAIKFARKWGKTRFSPQKYELVAFSGCFHGRTLGALSLTHREHYRQPFEPLLPGASFATFNDLASAEAAAGENTCAVIVEAVQGEGGINPADGDFLSGLRKLCDERKALLIFDEVQCGLGRTGYLFAHQRYGVEPDIMTLAKPLGGGLPIGATLVTDEVASVIEPGDHGSTFAANMLICNVANVVFRRIKDPAFLAAVREKGKYLRGKLEELQAGCELIKEVRGRGLMWGIELTIPAATVVERGYQAGIITVTAGENVLRLVPPLIIGKEELDWLLERLKGILAELQAKA